MSVGVNQLTVFMVVRADSQEAAARLFEGHPHMSVFPCDGIDVMPVLGDRGAGEADVGRTGKAGSPCLREAGDVPQADRAGPGRRGLADGAGSV